MQMRRLEILEGLPDEVFDGLLESAYEKAVKLKDPFASIVWHGSCHIEDSQHREISGNYRTALPAWKEAFDRLNS